MIVTTGPDGSFKLGGQPDGTTVTAKYPGYRLGRLVTGWVPQRQLRRLDARFQGITHLGNAIRCSGRVVEKLEHDGERCVRIELQSANQFGQCKIVGEALVALS